MRPIAQTIRRPLLLGTLLSFLASSGVMARTDEETAIDILKLLFKCPPPISSYPKANGDRAMLASKMHYHGNGANFVVTTVGTEIILGSTLNSGGRYSDQRARMSELDGATANNSDLTISCSSQCIWAYATVDQTMVPALEGGKTVQMPADTKLGKAVTFRMCDATTAKAAAEILNVFIAANSSDEDESDEDETEYDALDEELVQ